MESDRLLAGDLFGEGPTPSRYWGDHWLRVSEKLLKGLNHQLTNRVASLSAAVDMLKMDGVADERFVEQMSDEVTRLLQLASLYRCLTTEPYMEPEALMLSDMLPLALRLHENHYDLKHYTCSLIERNAVPPIRVRQAALLRCLLVLLGSTAGNALRSGRDGTITVEYGGDEQEVLIRMKAAAPGGQLIFTGDGSLLHAVRSALAHAHATADGMIIRGPAGDEVEYEIRIPTLTAMRRAEA
jgi:hypothetical protein